MGIRQRVRVVILVMSRHRTEASSMGTDRARRRPAAGLVLAVATGLALVACGPPGVTIINQSAMAISPAPGVLVAPCTSVRFSGADVQRMRALIDQWALGLIDDWPAAGVARMDEGIPTVPGRSYFLITSVREPELLADPPVDLPVCEGQPRGDFPIGQ